MEDGAVPATTGRSTTKKSPSKVVKHGRKKPRNTLVFQSYKKVKTVTSTRSKK
jgi:hypothetical protein